MLLMWIFLVALAKKINLISLAQCSKPVLDAGLVQIPALFISKGD